MASLADRIAVIANMGRAMLIEDMPRETHRAAMGADVRPPQINPF